jgi:hypothetical protein
VPQAKQKAAPLYGCLIIYFPYCSLIVPNYGNLQPVNANNNNKPKVEKTKNIRHFD